MKGRFPFVTILLLAVNLLVAAFSLGNQDMGERWGFIPDPVFPATAIERAMTMLTSMFVHLDPFHLLANMVFLAAAGPAVEGKAGAFRYFAVYLIGGLIGVLAHWPIASAAQPLIAGEPMFGASSAIAALIGYYWLRFYRTRVPIFPKVSVPVYVIVIVWVLLEAIGGATAVWMFGAQRAYWAHIGGFVSGFLLALVFKAGKEAVQESWQERMDEAAARSPAAQVSAMQEYLDEHPDDRSALKRMAEGLLAMGNKREGEEALLRLFEAEPAFDGAYAALKLCELKSAGAIPATERLKAATLLRNSHAEAAELLLSSILEEEPGNATPDALLMLIEIAEPSDQITARNYANQLAAGYALSPQAETARLKWPQLFANEGER